MGSGTVITFLAMLLGEGRQYIGIDINIEACKIARETAKLNHVGIFFCFNF